MEDYPDIILSFPVGCRRRIALFMLEAEEYREILAGEVEDFL